MNNVFKRMRRIASGLVSFYLIVISSHILGHKTVELACALWKEDKAPLFCKIGFDAPGDIAVTAFTTPGLVFGLYLGVKVALSSTDRGLVGYWKRLLKVVGTILLIHIATNISLH